MCGRYFLSEEEYEIQEILKEIESRQSGEVKTGEIYPTNTAPIIRRGNESKEIAAIKWGFPPWDGGGVVINARAETAFEKAMFKKSLLERRCVIPSTGFYEWHNIDGKKRKDKYLLKRPGTSMLYMAGVWNSFKSDEGEFPAFVILTTQSNDSMSPPDIEMSLFPDERKPIHERMPVILEPTECDDWLANGDFAGEVLRRQGLQLSLTLVET